MAKGGKTLSNGQRQSFTVEDYKESLISVGGSMSCAANALGITVQAFRERVRINPELKEFVEGFREGIDDFSVDGSHSYICQKKLEVLDARRVVGKKLSRIKNITGVNPKTVYAWLARDEFFKEQWEYLQLEKGEDWLEILEVKALGGDIRALQLILSSQYPELGFGKDNKQNVVVVNQNQHEGMLDAITEFITRRDECAGEA